MDYFKFKNDIAPEKGSLLISEPFLPDPNFERTVVLLCEHNDEGSFGFVLNKPSQVTVDEIVDNLAGLEATVFVGGPVEQNTLHFIHRFEQLEGGTEIGNGLWWGGNFEQLALLGNQGVVNTDDFRFFAGYSGWGEGQLESELDENSWIVTPPVAPELIFNSEVEGLWKTVLKQLGGRFHIYSNYPTDPRLN
ncbi:MAG: YqgE/AlgH family protein [Cyclobacteriaceae bacterium]